MKILRHLIALAILVPTVHAAAQEPAVFLPDSTISIVEAINTSGNITVGQPEAMIPLLVKHSTTRLSDEELPGDRKASNTRSGYRIQVFDDNNPHTAAQLAKARERQMESSFPQYRTYLTFNSPYWRVKVGDFRTRGEAEAAMSEIREIFPQFGAYLRIVRDKINTFD